MKKMSALMTASLLSTAAINVSAADLSEIFTFSGFGTFGVVQTDSNEGEYKRELQATGADKSASLLVDSNLGLQVSANINEWLSATVQTLTTQRTRDKLSTRVDWGFLKATPVEGMAIRVGKFNLANFMVSDYRNIGYANNWIRPSNEVYGLDLLNGGLRGGDISYRIPVGSNALTIGLLAGETTYTGTEINPIDVDNVKGLNLSWDGDWYSLRAGHIEANPQLDAELALFLPPGETLNERYKFSGVGGTVDLDNLFIQAEYVQRRSSQFNSFIGANAWYVMAGYRFGELLPFITIADLKPDGDAFVSPQETKAIGVRWDAFSAAAIKFQIERVDTKGTTGASFITPTVDSPFGPTPGPVNDPVHTFTVSIDYVF